MKMIKEYTGSNFVLYADNDGKYCMGFGRKLDNELSVPVCYKMKLLRWFRLPFYLSLNKRFMAKRIFKKEDYQYSSKTSEGSKRRDFKKIAIEPRGRGLFEPLAWSDIKAAGGKIEISMDDYRDMRRMIRKSRKEIRRKAASIPPSL